MKMIHLKAAAWVVAKLLGAIGLIILVCGFGIAILTLLAQFICISPKTVLLVVRFIFGALITLLVIYCLKCYYLDELQKLKQKEKNDNRQARSE